MIKHENGSRQISWTTKQEGDKAEPMLTILTHAPFASEGYLKVTLMRHLKTIIYFVLQKSHKAESEWYGGHGGVTISTMEGLWQNNIRYNLNPIKIEDIQPTVLVLANISALRLAISLKKIGHVETLLAGPNISNTPLDDERILTSKFIDKVICPSSWVKEMYEQQCPSIAGKVAVWKAGIDTDDFWTPAAEELTNKDYRQEMIILYVKKTRRKTESWEWAECIKDCKRYLRDRRIDYKLIIYGRYTKQRYRDLLRRSTTLIYWSDETESQGLALIEAASVGVRTFVSKKDHYTNNGVQFKASSAPYLKACDGSFFGSWTELKGLIRDYKKIGLDEVTERHKRIAGEFSHKKTGSELVKLIDENSIMDTSNKQA
jgi:hypothetical protein